MPALGGNAFAPLPGVRLVRLTAAGDLATRDVLAEQLQSHWPDWDAWIEHLLVVPIVRGDPTALRRQLEIAWRDGRRAGGQRPYHLAGFALGRLDAMAFTTAPCAGEARLWQTVGTALQAELAGDLPNIRAAWRAYLDLPWHRRITQGLFPDTSLEALAQWRVAKEVGHEP